MQLQNRTAFAHVMFISGLFGIAVGMAIVVYQALLHDPVLLGGRQPIPTWTTSAFSMMLGGSLAVLLYAMTLDRLFVGWYDIITGSAIIAQWGLPVSYYLSWQGDISISASFFVAVFGALNTLVALAFVGNYLRRGFPGPSLKTFSISDKDS